MCTGLPHADQLHVTCASIFVQHHIWCDVVSYMLAPQQLHAQKASASCSHSAGWRDSVANAQAMRFARDTLPCLAAFYAPQLAPLFFDHSIYSLSFPLLLPCRRRQLCGHLLCHPALQKCPLPVTLCCLTKPGCALWHAPCFPFFPAAGASFVGTFFVIPRFKDSFKEDLEWRDIYEALSSTGVKQLEPKEAYAKCKR